MPCRYRSYGDAIAEMRSLAAARPALARLWSTQQRYGLPSVGSCQGTPCMNWVLELTVHETLDNDPDRPDVLISGALHGDERVGPTATLELARWLLLSESPWAHRLLRTRRLLLVPLTNAVGYARGVRNEAGHDPNRDFSYQQKPNACMLTVAGRSLNELLRHHLVQLVVTFHGGMQACTGCRRAARRLGVRVSEPNLGLTPTLTLALAPSPKPKPIHTRVYPGGGLRVG
jgi:hypothetical protein